MRNAFLSFAILVLGLGTQTANAQYEDCSGPSVGGAILGAVVGGVVGSQVGRGSGRDLAIGAGAAGGAVAGGSLGSANCERRNAERRAEEERARRIETERRGGVVIVTPPPPPVYYPPAPVPVPPPPPPQAQYGGLWCVADGWGAFTIVNGSNMRVGVGRFSYGDCLHIIQSQAFGLVCAIGSGNNYQPHRAFDGMPIGRIGFGYTSLLNCQEAIAAAATGTVCNYDPSGYVAYSVSSNYPVAHFYGDVWSCRRYTAGMIQPPPRRRR